MRARRLDYFILAPALIALSFGLVMIYSSSSVIAFERHGSAYHYLLRQSIWTALGLAGAFVAIRFDYRRLARYQYLIYAVAVAGLSLVLIPGVGRAVNGARRWIDLGFVTFQPSEFVKLAMIIFFAAFLSRKIERGQIGSFKFGLTPALALLLVPLVLIETQPDMGSTLAILGTALFLFIVSGMSLSGLFIFILAAIPVALISIVGVGYRRARLLSFLDPWGDISNSGYQIIQSYVGFARGGAFGVGIGSSQQKLFYLPEAHTDFILSIMAEETGLVGAVCVLALFGLIGWRGWLAGAKAPDRFGALLAYGITFGILSQALINISVATGMAPTKGAPLPFISVGGSASVVWLIALGILLNIASAGSGVRLREATR